MKLAQASLRFDQQVFTDAHGTATVKGQMDLYDDSKRDGASSGRRILAMGPDVVIPTRRVLLSDGYAWIVGDGNPDYFNGTAIRRKYVLHQADGLATVKTFAQFLLGSAGLTAYAAVEWVKAAKEIDESSELIDVMMGVMAKPEAVPTPAIMTLGGTNYLLREPHPTAAGFQASYMDEIKGAPSEVGSFTSKVYDPVNDTSTGVTTPVTFLRLRWQTHFKYLSSRTLAYQPGDDMLVCLQSAATPKSNDKIVLSDGVWQVITVQPEGTCWSLHARRVPA